jgi:hypothetical protein
MITHIWSVLCLRSIVDAQTQNISLIDVIEEISLAPQLFEQSKEVILPYRFELVTYWRRSLSQQAVRANARIVVLDPEEKVLEQQIYDIDLSQYSKVRTRIGVPNFTVSNVGMYVFVIELQTENESWREVARVPLDISVRT